MEPIGQRLMKSEWALFYPEISFDTLEKIPAMLPQENGDWQCQRCGKESQESVPVGFFFCPHCLVLGRITSQQELGFLPEEAACPRAVLLDWVGKLSAAQADIARRLVEEQDEAATFLLWAVTGAGKTEILFPLLQKTLAQGKKIAVTSPRVDVCNELHLRLTKAFPEEGIRLFHGKIHEDKGGSLVICTVHQLLRFYRCFDLVILDEADAFPYGQDPLLEDAVARSMRKVGKLVYLSATPDKRLLEKVERCYRLPARYHRRALPVPEVKLSLFLEKALCKKRLPKKLLEQLSRLLQKNDVLLFCPSIPLLEIVAEQVNRLFPKMQLATVFSEDKERLVKVENMRAGSYRLLITTTILERGVTFERVSVVVLQASHHVFNKAALVQIAGRADRKGDPHEAEVLFFTSEWTKTIKQAIAEIKQNNQLAKKAGWINEM